MVVICTRCATQFQFDESRLPLEGAKVRCSRCKEAFFLAHPKAMSESEADFFEEQLPAELESPSDASLEEDSGDDEEVVDAAVEDDAEWSFDFNAQSELHESSDETALPVASVTEDQSRPASRSNAKDGEQAVFASVEDLADWLADRTDTLEMGPEPESTPEVPAPVSSPRPVQGAPVPLGMMVKKTLAQEKSSDRTSQEDGAPPSEQGHLIPGTRRDPSAEELLADLFGMSPEQVPPWLRSGIRSAVQVLGWGITLALVTAGLVKGLWSAL